MYTVRFITLKVALYRWWLYSLVLTSQKKILFSCISIKKLQFDYIKKHDEMFQTMFFFKHKLKQIEFKKMFEQTKF